MSKRPKPTIRNITYSEDKLKFIEQKLAQPSLSQYQKRGYLRRFLGGHCAICHEVPTKIASYDMGGISLIEKYCDKCIVKINIT
jgi:mono/diheme cytochrome c family protein